MTGKTISTTITHTVTLGSAYPSPLTVTSTGNIAPAATAAIGIYLPGNAAFATIVNHGVVGGGGGGNQPNYVGGPGGIAIELKSSATLNNTGSVIGGGGYSSDTGGDGGIGILVLATSTLVNSGLIQGGGGAYGHYGAGAGGMGIDLAVSATLTNSGTIRGGTGGGSYVTPGGTESAGGIAVSAASEAFITNTGLIVGGLGGAGGSYQQQTGNTGGTALVLGQGGSLTNSATIIGGGGGNADLGSLGGVGGIGVYVDAASVTNTGHIVGGVGGYVAADKYFSAGGRGGVGLRASNYASVNNAGTITAGAGGGYEAGGGGGGAVTITGGATVTNTGHILGGNGGGAVNYFMGGYGGDGVRIDSGTFINRGTVVGGLGGYAAAIPPAYGPPEQFSGDGGYGVVAVAYGQVGVSLANYGVITGGLGGSLTSEDNNPISYGTAGVGGIGVFLYNVSFANHGTVTGGVGGYSGPGPGLNGTAGVGGVGVFVEGGATLTNSGTISGGLGGVNVEVGVAGGAGVLIAGGTFIDSGTVKGGAGGVATDTGPRGDAVYFAGGTAGTLVLNPGVTFTGIVAGVSSVSDVVELAGTSTGTLAGFGTEFVDIRVVSFATGAQRIAEGSIAGFSTIDGFAAHDAIVLDGYTAILKETEFSGSNEIVLFNSLGGTTLDISHPNAKDFILTDAGGKTTIAAVVGTLAHTIGSGAEEFVLSGGTATSSTINAGGVEQIHIGGTGHALISGGTLELQVGGKLLNGVSFAAGKGGTFIIDSTKMPTETISGFATGDTIKLAGVGYNTNDTVTVATAGTVTVKTPGTNYNLSIAGATVGETDFHFGTGSLLTKSAAPKMAFIAQNAVTASLGGEISTGGTGWFADARLPVEAWRSGQGSGLGFVSLAAPAMIHGMSAAFMTLSEAARLEAAGLEHHGAGVI